MTGLQKRGCPTSNGDCYWCRRDLAVIDRHRRVTLLDGTDPACKDLHAEGCPWREVIDYHMLEDEWAVREAKHVVDPPGPPDPG